MVVVALSSRDADIAAESKLRLRAAKFSKENSMLPAVQKPTRIAWSGGEIKTNKDEALSRFLERKGDVIDPRLLQSALVQNAALAAVRVDRAAAEQPPPQQQPQRRPQPQMSSGAAGGVLSKAAAKNAKRSQKRAAAASAGR